MRLIPVLSFSLAACAILQGSAQAGPVIGRCPIFPANNVWNTPIDTLPVDPSSDAYIQRIGADIGLKADFGSGLVNGAPFGIPYSVVPMDQPKVEIRFEGFGDEPVAWPDESDAGPYPIPPDAEVEGGSDAKLDRHVIVVQQGSCTLFELYKAAPNPDGSWNAVAAAKFDLEGNEMRPLGWTSADAAGLPVFPGLVRFEDVVAGEIEHAFRFTVPETRNAFVWPARHEASDSEDPSLPPMGQRFRLKADVDVSGFSVNNQRILRALKKYGMILADNGSAWFLSGTSSDWWDNDELRELLTIKGSDFEAVDTSGLIIDPDSAEARQP